MIARLKEKLADVEPSLPERVQIVTTYDRSELIGQSIDTLRDTLTEEMIVVSLFILLFLWHIPSALIPIVTLPAAVLLAFIPMKMMNLSANIMSLAGIAVAVGAMVDAAIVVVEQTHKKLERWEEGGRRGDYREVVITAVKEVGRPSFFSLLVLAIAFLPVFTLEAQEGRLFKPLAFSKTFTMAWAAFLSITLGPALIVLMTGKKVIPEHKHPISRLLHRLYYPWVSALMRRRVLSIAIAVAAVALPLPNHTGHSSAAESHTVTTRSNGTSRISATFFGRPRCSIPISLNTRRAN